MFVLKHFYFFLRKRQEKDKPQKKIHGQLFYLSLLFLLSHLFFSLWLSSRREMCNKLLPIFDLLKNISAIKMNQWRFSTLQNMQTSRMNATSPVTVTVSVTQELCQCAPKLSHISSILYCMKLRMKRKSWVSAFLHLY